MTLAGRLSLFFLAALAIVLVGFSASLYGLSRYHLLHQLDARCGAVLDTLTAPVEDEPGGLEWEAGERLPPARAGGDGTLVWAVFDRRGRRVPGSPAVDLPAGLTEPLATEEDSRADVTWEGAPWRFARRTLRSRSAGDNATTAGGPGAERPRRYRVLVFVVGLPVGPVWGTLRTLAVVLAALSLVLWCSAALVGRWLCRRALAPVTRMARTARTLTADDLDRRLADPGTGDELSDLGAAFNDLLTRLAEAFRRQRRFTGEASHQLRTPLTALLGQVEVALRRERPAEEYRRVLETVQKQGERLRQIVDLLLFLARADAGSGPPQTETLDLGAWLADHLRSWGEHPRSGDILAVRAGAHLGPLWVRAHAGLLGQVLDNLLDNACKYSAAGSPVRLRAWRQEGEVRLAVEDRGHGIGAEDLGHVFDPFFRSAEARRCGVAGVGLGLAVTARIVEALGGSIEATSEPGRGSCFVVALPCAGDPGVKGQ
jgi:heavy metal sensor kinase